jgi:hypothetical protein
MRYVWLVVFFSLLFAAPRAQGQDDVKFFPESEVRPGMKGIGRTVFEGDRIDEFQVDIIGVLKNALAPKQDLILAKLSGGPLAKTGVIAGMSGSPVYIDGKLLGAVALGFPFSKDALAGITPIEQMLHVRPETAAAAKHGVSGAKTASSHSGFTGDELPGPGLPSATGFRIVKGPGGLMDARLIPDKTEFDWKNVFPVSAPNTFMNLALPLRFGGFAGDVVQNYASVFRSMGFEPESGGILSGTAADRPAGGALDKNDASKLEPGSMISLFLVSGDLNLNADCTVTYHHGNDVYACGHRLLLAGPSQIPFGPAHVLTTVASLASSFKLDAPGEPIGSIRQDRFAAIYGQIGNKAEQIPVHLRLDSTLNTQSDYNFNLVQDPFLSPFLLNMALVSTLSATERMLGPSTLEVSGKIRLSSGDLVDVDDVVSAEVNAANGVGFAVSTPLTYVLGSAFPDLRVEGIDLSIASRDELRLATLDQVWSNKSEVRPGDHLEVTAVLRTPSGESATQKIPVDIPESISDKTLSLVVGSGSTINAVQNRLASFAVPPRDVHQLVRALNRTRRNNRIYALLMAPQRSFVMQGDEYPSPPPSLVQTMMSDPASSGITFSGTSVVGDFETKAVPYTIRGEKTIALKVVRRGA